MEENDHKAHPIKIVVHNEDTGKTIDLDGESTDRVQQFIDKLYEALRSTHKDGDRLRCGGSGVNVFSFAALAMTDFQRQHCAAREWTFAGATGGALCSHSR
jgi:hypothetical protein